MPRLSLLAPLTIVAALFALPVAFQPAIADDNLIAKPGAKPGETAADGEVAAGHSSHGEIFNEGPRQKAYLMGDTGEIVFKITTKSPEAQQFFLQGMGQLHGFWYFEAERSFRQALALDPDCAMPYVGIALANLDNPARGAGFIAEAEKRKAGVSPHESKWIDAIRAFLPPVDKNKKTPPPSDVKPVANDNKEATQARRKKLVEDLEAIIHEFPEDLEAKAFLAKHLWLNHNAGMTIYSNETVDALIAQVLAKQPLHPVHHYKIHLWDGKKTERALPSAALCGQSAPNVAHMWHMPGHIFSGLKRYEDAVWQQEASSRVDHKHMIHDRILPDQIHNYAHNQDWLAKNLTYIGRVSEAIDLAKNLVELPRHPKYNVPTSKGSSRLGRDRLFTTLNRFELWDQLIQLTGGRYLEATEAPTEQVKRIKAIGIAWFGKHDLPRGQEQMAELKKRLDKLKTDRMAAADKAEQQGKDRKDSDEKIAKAMADALVGYLKQMRPLESALAELSGHEAMAQGNWKLAQEKFKAADPGKDVLARVALELGDKALAERLAREVVDAGKNEVLPLANQAYVLHRIGKKDEAEKAFTRLRELAGHADLNLPAFERLAPLAKELNLPDDWRQPRATPSDVGNRPELASLGPFRWHPTEAPEWKLPDDKENYISLADYRGKPVVVIFYLGYGCLHCVEQLKAFAPMVKDYEAAGISVVAISTDSVSEVKRSLEPKEGNPTITFPLLSDPDMNVFKAYRSYDDFEKLALHATVLIDGQGLIRWQDISFEPFTDAKFVLKEAQRLVQLDKPEMHEGRPAPTVSAGK